MKCKNRFFSFLIWLSVFLVMHCDQQAYGQPTAKENIEKQPNNAQQTESNNDANIVHLSAEQIKQMGLEYKTAEPGTLFLTLSTRGKIILQPDRLAHIIPKVAGIAKQADKNIGNPVKLGEEMAILESQDMAVVKATFLAALSKQRLALSSFEREEKLYKEKVSSAEAFQNARNTYEEAIINVQLAKQKLTALGLDDQEIEYLGAQNDPDLRLYVIRSPIDGTVIARHITQGEFIENTRIIYTVANLSSVWVDIGIYPKDLYKVKEGQIVEIVVPIENLTTRAKIIYVSPIVENETITASAIAELDNPQGIWRPGVFVKVNIATDKISLPLVILKEAVQSSEGKDFIFVVTPKGFEKRIITLGRSDNNNVEVLSGINSGEQYVVNKTFLLKAELGKQGAKHEDAP